VHECSTDRMDHAKGTLGRCALGGGKIPSRGPGGKGIEEMSGLPGNKPSSTNWGKKPQRCGTGQSNSVGGPSEKLEGGLTTGAKGEDKEKRVCKATKATYPGEFMELSLSYWGVFSIPSGPSYVMNVLFLSRKREKRVAERKGEG